MAVVVGVGAPATNIEGRGLNIHHTGILYLHGGTVSRCRPSQFREVFFMPSGSKKQQKAYDEKRKLDRPYNWNLVLYPDDLPPDAKARLKSLTPGYCSPLHKPEGDKTKDHYHMTLCFKNKTSRARLEQTLKDMFGELNGSIIGVATPMPCVSVTGSVRYMAHADDPEKIQYKREDIEAWGGKSVDKVWGDEESIVRERLVAIENIIEAQNIVELSDLSTVLRAQERWELYDVLSRRCTTYINAVLASRRHRAERIEESKSERAVEAVEIMDIVPCDPETGEVLGDLPEGVLSSDSTLGDGSEGDGARAALDNTGGTEAP